MVTATRRTASYAAIISVAAAPFVAGWEGTDHVAKHLKFDRPGVITWCHGNTNMDDPTVKVGTKFTDAQCDELLAKTLPKYLAPVQKCLKVDVTDNQMISLLSAAYNAGTGAVCKSPMVHYFNAGKPKEACNAFVQRNAKGQVIGWYVSANHVVLPGLINRRVAERKLCQTEDHK